VAIKRKRVDQMLKPFCGILSAPFLLDWAGTPRKRTRQLAISYITGRCARTGVPCCVAHIGAPYCYDAVVHLEPVCRNRVIQHADTPQSVSADPQRMAISGQHERREQSLFFQMLDVAEFNCLTGKTNRGFPR